MTIKILVQQTPARITRLLFLTIGVVCLAIYSYAYLYRITYQLYEGWKFDRLTTEPIATRTTLPSMLPDPDRGAPSTAKRMAILGKISIPRLHLSAMVEEGIDSTTLSRSVGHIPGTAFPGERGNVGIAGHRDTFFRALNDLRPHDQIDFITHKGRFHYTVESLTIVEPNNVGVLRSSGGHTLTIVTCFPFHYIGNAPRRFIVRAIAN